MVSLLATSTFAQSGFNRRTGEDSPLRPQLQQVRLQQTNIDQFDLDLTKTIALTFDDGPGDGTSELLDLLKKYHIKASFFVIGENAALPEYKKVMQRIVAEGHVLANHSYTHPHMNDQLFRRKPQLLVQEFLKTHKIIRQYLRPGSNLYFRAPYGDWQTANSSPLNHNSILKDYIGPIEWDIGSEIAYDKQGRMIDAADWECWEDRHWTPEQCSVGYKNRIDDLGGGVVLSHTITMQSTQMWRILLPQLIREGYKFITLDQLPSLQIYRDQNKNPLNLDDLIQRETTDI